MPTNKPLVSVLMPAYNHQKYVQETIKSIINQTYQNIELIVIDDGSKDDTWNKIQELKPQCEKRFARCSFQTQQNKGTCYTFNKLLAQAQGEYVYIIASDDLVKPNSIELQVDFLIKHPEYSLVVGDNEIIDSKGEKCYWDKNRNNVYNKNEAKFLTFVDYLKNGCSFFNEKNFGTYESLQIGNYIPNGYLIRKSTLDKVEPFSKDAPLEDYFLMLQLSKYSKFKYLNKVLFSYRWHGANTITNVEKIEKYTNMVKQYEKEILSKLDFKNTLPDVEMAAKYGFCYKSFGVPHLFEIKKYLKDGKKTRIVNIFNYRVHTYTL